MYPSSSPLCNCDAAPPCARCEYIWSVWIVLFVDSDSQRRSFALTLPAIIIRQTCVPLCMRIIIYLVCLTGMLPLLLRHYSPSQFLGAQQYSSTIMVVVILRLLIQRAAHRDGNQEPVCSESHTFHRSCSRCPILRRDSEFRD